MPDFEEAYAAHEAEILKILNLTAPPPGARRLMRIAFFSGTAFMLAGLIRVAALDDPALRAAVVAALREEQAKVRATLSL